MNIRDLQYLVTLAETKHFGKAAEACYVSQPSLSTQIKKLEEELGITLIERTRKKVLITAAGEKIIAQAREVLNEVQNLRSLAKRLQNPKTMTIQLGVIPTIAPYILPQLSETFHNNMPEVTLKLIEAHTHSLIDMLLKGKLDLLLLALPLHTQGVIEHELYREPFLAALPHSHPLTQKDYLEIEDLQDESLLLLEDGHCLRQQALSLCDRINTQDENYSGTSLQTLLHMVAAGHGITLVPKMAVEMENNVVYKPLNAKSAQRVIGLAWRSNSVIEEHINELLPAFENFSSSG